MSTPAAQVEPSRFVASRWRQLALSIVFLTIAVACGFAVVAWWIAARGPASIQAAAIAAIVCWFAATVALLVSSIGQNTPAAVPCLLGGTLIRMFIPGAVGVMIDAQRGPLAQAGVLGYVVVFFLLTLVVETGLLLRLLRGTAPMVAASMATAPMVTRSPLEAS